VHPAFQPSPLAPFLQNHEFRFSRCCSQVPTVCVFARCALESARKSCPAVPWPHGRGDGGLSIHSQVRRRSGSEGATLLRACHAAAACHIDPGALLLEPRISTPGRVPRFPLSAFSHAMRSRVQGNKLLLAVPHGPFVRPLGNGRHFNPFSSSQTKRFRREARAQHEQSVVALRCRPKQDNRLGSEFCSARSTRQK